VTKGPQAFRTISEASDELGVPQHVLRFWETKFSFIRPMKRAGGRRFYRPQDLAVLKGVRVLLHDDGYTIKGVQRLHKEQGVKRLLAAGGAGDESLEADADALETDVDEAAFAASPAREAEAGPEANHLNEESEQGLLDALDALEAARARLRRILPGD
jgi:DNA-binding transcriptional MerR regulator